jgi:DNA helicase-2/ATP-dependent DNA helicase PcrA
VEYLNELNKEQREAVVHGEGPMMVIAGAGSGKTRVLTYRIAHLVNHGVDPFNILALTFTNKAAREMKARIGKVVGDQEVRNIWMGTFHSIFAKILRMEADRINYPRNFTIYDTQDSKNLLRDIIKEMSLSDKVYKPNVVFGRISAAKNNLISPEAYRRNTEIMSEDSQAGRPRLVDIYTEYAKRCFRSGAMDFDDLLYKTNVLLRDHADLLHKYQNKFHYILVDEYQDTNFAQYLIVKQLAAARQNICVVGDDAQSIYAFRGANIQNILNFRNDYPEYVLYKLEQNYRSTKVIVEAANSVIDKNTEQIKKSVWTENAQGDLIRVHRSYSDNDEGSFVAHDIFEIQNQNQLPSKDFAILYRTNAQSRSFEEALRKLNVPYRIYGGLSFYQRKEIKDLLAYFRLTANPNDEEALKRIINYPARGIGKTTMEKLLIASNKYDQPIWEIISHPHTYNTGLNKGTVSKIGAFSLMIQSFQSVINKKNAFDVADHIAQESGLVRELNSDKTPEGVSRYDNIQELINGIKEFSDRVDPDNPDKINTLPDFLVDVALLTDADNEDDDDNKVSMMTIHAAKGLEFPYVYIVGMEENLFPSQLALSSRSELEEERRLFYVAITRAEKRATLSYALTRYRWGQLSQCEPSRFLEDIDERFLSMPKVSPKQANPFAGKGGFDAARQQFYKPMGGAQQANTPPKPNMKKVGYLQGQASSADLNGIQVGTEVEHARFGKGKVLKIEGAVPNHKATVYFPAAGQKQLLLKFAKLKILS